jgi:hypothetical protein
VDYDVTLLIPQVEDIPVSMPSHEGASTYNQNTPLGQLTADSFAHWISEWSHQDIDMTEFLDTNGDGFVDSIAFMHPGTYLFNWILDGLTSYVVSPPGGMTGIENDSSGGDMVLTNKAHTVNAATTESNMTYTIYVPNSAFPHHSWDALPVEDAPRLNLTGGNWASTSALWSIARLAWNRHAAIA